MEELTELFREMKNDFSQKLIAIESRIACTEEKITSKLTSHMNKKFQDLNKDLENQRLELENQDKRLSTIERQTVQRNLVFFGIDENEKSYFQLQDKVLDIINNKIKIKTESFEIQSLRRIGTIEDGRIGIGKKPRPISVSLTTLGKKIQILKNKKTLSGSNIYIQEDFPKRVLEIRKDLKIQQKIELEKGKIAYLKYDKLVVKNKNETAPNKRQLSESPEQSSSKTLPNESACPLRISQRQSHKKLRATAKPITSYMTRPESA